MADGDRGGRIGAIVGAVMAEAVRNAGAGGIVVMFDDSPQARLARDWCAGTLGGDAVHCVAPPEADAVSALTRSLAGGGSHASVVDAADGATDEEAHRFLARSAARARRALVAHPANKTTLLLGGAPPPEPLLPLGDLYATQVSELAGGWSAPDPVRSLADRAGGIDRLDRALAALVDERRPAAEALGGLPDDVGDAVVAALEVGRFGRRRLGIVPKLSARTAGIDFFA